MQEKTWQVLESLLAAAPGAISRETLIHEVWGSRWTTGEKGLNQTIWQLRTALSDDARAPEFIQTIPRFGYRWIGPGVALKNRTSNSSRWRSVFYAMPFLLLPVNVMLPSNLDPGGATSGVSGLPDRTAVAAYLDPLQRIVVDLEGGCRGLIVPSAGKMFGQPAISMDGGSVAFTVTEIDSCKTVTVRLADYSRQEFENCPVDT